MSLVAMLFVACGEKPVSLEDTTWKLITLDGAKVDREANNEESYSLGFKKEESGIRAYGKGDCNRFFGMAKIDMKKGTIELGAMGSTRAMCPNQTQEDTYLKTLGTVSSYKVKGGELTLFSGDKSVLVYTQVKEEVK